MVATIPVAPAVACAYYKAKCKTRGSDWRQRMTASLQQTTGGLWEMTCCAPVISFIGAGGKTSSVERVAFEIAAKGRKVVATTTTKVFPAQFSYTWRNANSPPPREFGHPCFWYAALDHGGYQKWQGPQVVAVDAAIDCERLYLNSAQSRVWVIEADGARERKLKGWEAHEPQIPQQTVCAVLILAGTLWGKIIQPEDVHRPEKLSGVLGSRWNADLAWRYFLQSPVFYPSYSQMNWVILLNENGETANNDCDKLSDLGNSWQTLRSVEDNIKDRPSHLRLAGGNVREGKLKWFDLW